jgi:hypothetical protein
MIVHNLDIKSVSPFVSEPHLDAVGHFDLLVLGDRQREFGRVGIGFLVVVVGLIGTLFQRCLILRLSCCPMIDAAALIHSRPLPTRYAAKLTAERS